MGVASGCGEQEAGVGGIYGCGYWVWLKGGIYRFPHTTYPYSSCICFFFTAASYFLFILKMFFVFVIVLFGN